MSCLTDHKVLTFDVYGTLIDWEHGLLHALQPMLSKKKTPPFAPYQILSTFHTLEAAEQMANPSLPYSQLLIALHPKMAMKLELPEPTQVESEAFGYSVGSWSAFPDTINALQRLSNHFKLVVLSNVDRESFSRTNAGPLMGVRFDAILTAQDIGSYKPNQKNFQYMLDYVKKEFGIERSSVLQTAQSQFHDHYPARKSGIRSVWIERPGAIMGNVEESEAVYDWKFETLGDMADAVEAELRQ